MNKHLRYNYFIREDGSVVDSMRDILNCMEARVALLIKNQLKNLDEEDIFYYFLRDINYYLKVDESKLSWKFIDKYISVYEQMVSKKFFEGKGINTLELIKKSLIDGKYVLINTMNSRLPFSSFFKSYTDDSFSASSGKHIILLVGYDNNLFYYAEAPWMLNYDNYCGFESNRSIGIATENELLPAADAYINYHVINSIQNKYIIEKDIFIKDFLFNQYLTYNSMISDEKRSSLDDNNIVFGINAFELLINMIKNKQISDKTVKDDILPFVKEIILRRRRIEKCIEVQLKCKKDKFMEEMFDSLNDMDHAYQVFLSLLLKFTLQPSVEYKFDEVIFNIQETERVFYKLLKKDIEKRVSC